MTMRGVAPPEATMMYIFRAVTPFLLPSIGVLALVFVVPGTAT
jgi:TRAP-type mannitol/chloroaromatic compound transport system permease large subunit